MRTILLQNLILTFLFIPAISFSQNCSRPVEAFMAAPGGYSISGTAIAEFTSEGNTLTFDNAFGTQSGPDLHVYLAINFEAPSAQGNTNIDLGELTSNSGAQSYSIPSNVLISDYDYVLIHCLSFNHWWGGGLLGDIDCVSAIEQPNEESSISIYPNPASDWITVNTPEQQVEKIWITDVLGKVRITQREVNTEVTNINIGELESGVFFILFSNAKGELIENKSFCKL